MRNVEVAQAAQCGKKIKIIVIMIIIINNDLKKKQHTFQRIKCPHCFIAERWTNKQVKAFFCMDLAELGGCTGLLICWPCPSKLVDLTQPIAN